MPAGRVSDEPWAFWDFLPTAAELAGAKLPAGFKTDGLSLVSLLKGGAAPQRDYFYWELHESDVDPGGALRRLESGEERPSAAIELYDLKTDAGETKDLAADRPELVTRAEALMK